MCLDMLTTVRTRYIKFSIMGLKISFVEGNDKNYYFVNMYM